MKSNPPVPPRRSFSISSESGKASLPGTASPFGTAAEWRSALDAGRVSSEALVRAHLDRIAAFNPQLNAIVALDSEAALTAARTFDAGGGNCGPLSGIPMTVKDSLEVSGFTAVCGAPALKDHRPRVDATAVARLRGAGAIILGKTNVPLYASDYQTFNEVFGTTANPYALDRTPGGSSGGAAAALAAGLTPVELGTDLAGSLRIPAHACGVASLKPSFGVVPLAGSLCAPPGRYRPRDLWVVGPMARSVADLRLLYDIIADPVPDAAAAPRRWRVALWADDPFCPTDPVVGEALETAARALAATGRVDVTEAWPDAGSEEFFLTHCRLMYAEMAGGLPDDVASYFARRA